VLVTLGGQAAAQPAPAGSIAGTVYEDVGPLDVIRAIGAATVYLQVPDTVGGPFFWEMPYRTIDSAVSDRSGGYAFRSLATGTGYRVTFSHPSYQYKQVNLTLEKDTTLNVWMLPLDAAGGISGVITEKCPDGMMCLWNPPVPGCTVEVWMSMLVCAMDAQWKAAAPDTVLRAVTDSLGRYRIEGVPIYESYSCYGYSYRIHVSKAGFAAAYQSFEPAHLMTVTVNAEIERVLATRQSVPQPRGGVLETVKVSGSNLVVTLAQAQSVGVELMLMDGRRVDEGSYSRFLTAGTHQLDIGTGITPGVYLVRVSADGAAKVRKVRVGK
jgi:hypothetical protein